MGKPGGTALTKEQIAAIVHKISTGELVLPDLDKEIGSDEDQVAIWALLDGGSAVHAAGFAKHFPGAKTLEQARLNFGALDLKLSDQHCQALEVAAKRCTASMTTNVFQTK